MIGEVIKDIAQNDGVIDSGDGLRCVSPATPRMPCCRHDIRPLRTPENRNGLTVRIGLSSTGAPDHDIGDHQM
jgi:hypothetical protein